MSNLTGVRGYAFSAAVALLLAGCAHSGSLPSAPSQSLPDMNSVGVTAAFAGPVTADNGAACPKDTVCVKQGGSGSIKWTLTCTTSSGVTVSCKKVTWKTKITQAGLTASFKPNPGNPSVETVKAAKSVKPGTYTQFISFKCTASKTCKGGQNEPIKVSK